MLNFYLKECLDKELIRKSIKDKDVLNTLDLIIDSTDADYINQTIKKIKNHEIKRLKNSTLNDLEKEKKIKEIEDLPEYKKGKGFPIGNMSSQIFAIAYLNELDHYIKEKLKIKYYIRYMDDGILIHEDKEYLRYCLKCISEILQKYKLNLNVKKTKIDSLNNGIDFLGFRFFIINNKIVLKLRNDTKKRFKKKAKVLNKMFSIGRIDEKEYDNLLASYKGHLMLGNCGELLFRNVYR